MLLLCVGDSDGLLIVPGTGMAENEQIYRCQNYDCLFHGLMLKRSRQATEERQRKKNIFSRTFVRDVYFNIFPANITAAQNYAHNA